MIFEFYNDHNQMVLIRTPLFNLKSGVLIIYTIVNIELGVDINDLQTFKKKEALYFRKSARLHRIYCC